MAKADERFLVLSASEGEASVRFHGPPCDTVDEAVALRDKLRKGGALGRAMRAAAQPSATQPRPRWYLVVGAVSDEVVVSDEEAVEAAARAASLGAIRQQPAGAPPVPLGAIEQGTAGEWPREEKRADD